MQRFAKMLAKLVTVDVKSINVTESRSLGPELVAHSAWKQLCFAEILSTVGMDSKVYVKKVPLTEGCRILCLSEGRKQKEAAMDTLKERRFLEDIGKLEQSITKGSILLQRRYRSESTALREDTLPLPSISRLRYRWIRKKRRSSR